MKLSEELIWRGFQAENTFDQISDLDRTTHKFYWGTDPSADSLHIGHLAALMMCACFIRHGYEPYLLVGGATGQIGDPKETSERDLKPLDEIEHNKKALNQQIRRIIKADNLQMLDNYDWFKSINFLHFLREVGKVFSMTQLLDRQFVQARIGAGASGISYAEFSYTLIQGYDFLHLYRTYGIDLQLCGADQFGNCASGIHLIKRLENARADSYSCPLIIDRVTGRKFGKSEGNAVWLDSEKTSVFDFYQFWLNQPDEAVSDYLKYFTLIMPAEHEDLMQRHLADPSQRLAQKYLAKAATEITHGVDQAASVIKITDLLFGKSQLQDLSPDDLLLLEHTIPTIKTDIGLVDALVATNLAPSKSAARKLIESNSISINQTKVSSDTIITRPALIKKGKNKFIYVK